MLFQTIAIKHIWKIYGYILDEDRRKNAELMENAFYNKENLRSCFLGLIIEHYYR